MPGAPASTWRSIGQPRARSKCSPATASGRWRSCGLPESRSWRTSASRGGRLDELDSLVEVHLAVERPVDRTLGGDDAQLVDLLLGAAARQAHHELEVRQAAAVGRRVLALDLDRPDVPSLALGVHLHRDRGARGQACRQQLLRTWALVVAAVLGRLVGDYLMLPDVDPVGECVPCGAACDGLHLCGPRWSKLCV